MGDLYEKLGTSEHEYVGRRGPFKTVTDYSFIVLMDVKLIQTNTLQRELIFAVF
jgi:hypothetical protein